MIFNGVETNPFRVRLYYLGFIKCGATVLNIPVVCEKKAFVKNYIKSKGISLSLLRIKITPFGNHHIEPEHDWDK